MGQAVIVIHLSGQCFIACRLIPQLCQVFFYAVAADPQPPGRLADADTILF
jgi:hypothetical protein